MTGRERFNSDGEGNNYIQFLYYLNNSRISTHLDKIMFGVYDQSVYGLNKGHEQRLLDALTDYGYKNPKKGYARTSKYHRKRKQYLPINNNPLIQIDHGLKPYCIDYLHVPRMMMIIHDPNKEIVEWFDSVLNGLGYASIMKQIEMTIDFFNFQDQLQLFFWDHLFLSYCKTKSWFDRGKRPTMMIDGEIHPESTYYIGDTRKNSKAIRLYRKQDLPLKPLRLELVSNRPVNRRLEYELPLDNINSSYFTEVVRFKEFNREKLRDYLIKKNRYKISRMTELRKKFFIACLRTYYDFNGTLMQKVSQLKECFVNNSSYFLDDMDDFNKAFADKLRDRVFLPSKDAVLGEIK